MPKGKYEQWLTEEGLLRLEGCFKVYMHIFPNNKKYIGITCQSLKKRWRNGSGYKDNRYLENALKKYSWDEIEHVLLYDYLTKDQAEFKEIQLIKMHKAADRKYGYNISIGGNASGVLTEEVRKKISLSKKGKGQGIDNPFYGKKHNEKTKAILSDIAKKRKHSKETREKITEKNKIKLVQLDMSANKIKEWGSAKEVENSIGVFASSIASVCKGKRKTAGGYKWCYGGDCNA